MASRISVGINTVPIPRDDLIEAGKLAEQLGYESLWCGEHTIVPFEYDSEFPMGGKAPFDPNTPFFEPFAALSALAMVTKTIRLGSGIMILPLRNTYAAARSIATTDFLSGGRLEVGVGAGWLEQEFRTMGADFQNRFKRMEEALAVIDELFTAERPKFQGEYHKLVSSGFAPKPKQTPRPPILLGGNTPVAFRRVARLGDGWISSKTSVEEARFAIDYLKKERGDRKPLTYTIQGPPDSDLEAYAKVGVERMVIAPWDDPKNWREGMEAYARRYGLKA